MAQTVLPDDPAHANMFNFAIDIMQHQASDTYPKDDSFLISQ